ncbi:ras-related protein Rab-13-like [Mercenaria mercenaria]|uniref:ras-related protein Rab-13-like n=1 Tax=Mercenaria mercenaria TaxID=6596 RepID=UPI00234F7B68|nr:ras-related protein Rab-13-like [Mercenaria mercenaria]XP_045176456.2 ras-related protein Rab-13-like [Mercenaria mercenaria]
MPLSDADCVATYKILILGDSSVGKTALLRCLTGRDFQDRQLPTIATDFVKKKFEVDGALVELQIWDTAGQERFHSVNRWQYRGVKGVVMVYDVTDKSTFTHLPYWLSSVNDEIAQTHNKYEVVPIVLIGNKCDLQTDRKIKTKEGMKLAEKELTSDFYETSAKTGQNVFNAFHKLAYCVTEICNPNVMKSYYPNMIREQPSLAVTVPETRTYPVVKANMTKNVVTIEWRNNVSKSANDVKRKKCFKWKSKKLKLKLACCCSSSS